MAEGRAEDAGFSVLIDPENGVRFAALFAFSGDQRFGVGPEFFDYIEFVHRRNPVGGKVSNDGMAGVYDGGRVVALVIVASSSHSEEFAPIVHFRCAVGVHGAVDDDCGGSGFVGFEDFGNVCGVGGVGVALVVHDDIVFVGPIRIVEQLGLIVLRVAAFMDEGPLDGSSERKRGGEGLFLEVVVVTTAAGYEQGANGIGDVGLSAAGEKKGGKGKEGEEEMSHRISNGFRVAMGSRICKRGRTEEGVASSYY